MQSQFSDTLMIQDVDERVKVMYEGVKQIASKYRNGKLPKAFKVIPKLVSLIFVCVDFIAVN